MKLFVCIFDDARLLPHFLKHYARFGITEFHIAAPVRLAGYVASVSEGYAAKQYNDFNVADSVTGGVTAVAAMRALAQAPDEWVVIVDLDEFVEFPEPVPRIVPKIAAEGAIVARGIMIDRFAIDGQPTAFDENSDLPALYPVRARFIERVMGGVDYKGVVVHGHLESSGAHHIFSGERLYSQNFEISHYKWNDLALARVRQAYQALSASGAGWAVQYQKILDHYDAHGRFAWESFGGELASPPALASK